jgi:hypothetical protein
MDRLCEFCVAHFVFVFVFECVCVCILLCVYCSDPSDAVIQLLSLTDDAQWTVLDQARAGPTFVTRVTTNPRDSRVVCLSFVPGATVSTVAAASSAAAAAAAEQASFWTIVVPTAAEARLVHALVARVTGCAITALSVPDPLEVALDAATAMGIPDGAVAPFFRLQRPQSATPTMAGTVIRSKHRFHASAGGDLSSPVGGAATPSAAATAAAAVVVVMAAASPASPPATVPSWSGIMQSASAHVSDRRAVVRVLEEQLRQSNRITKEARRNAKQVFESSGAPISDSTDKCTYVCLHVSMWTKNGDACQVCMVSM